jgi:hypothetical protein
MEPRDETGADIEEKRQYSPDAQGPGGEETTEDGGGGGCKEHEGCCIQQVCVSIHLECSKEDLPKVGRFEGILNEPRLEGGPR